MNLIYYNIQVFINVETTNICIVQYLPTNNAGTHQEIITFLSRLRREISKVLDCLLQDVPVMPWIATFFCNLYPINMKLRPDLRIVLTQTLALERCRHGLHCLRYSTPLILVRRLSHWLFLHSRRDGVKRCSQFCFWFGLNKS